MKLFAAFTFTLLTHWASGQDYAVTTKNDTLRGRVSILSLPTMDQVQVEDQSKSKEYPSYSILTVSLDSQTYHTIKTTEGYRFMKLSRPGYLSVYLSRQSQGMPYNITYLVKRTGRALEVPTLLFRKQITDFLSDCAYIKQKIVDEDLGRKNLDQIIDAYNRCLENQTAQTFTPASDPRLTAISDLQTKLEKNPTVSPDVPDILKDIYQKVKENKQVPNYLMESLRELLKTYPEYQSDLDGLLAKLKG